MSEPFDHLLEKYARLVIRVGVNVQPGQEVVVNCLPEQADAARALAEEAYRVGASRVSIDYDRSAPAALGCRRMRRRTGSDRAGPTSWRRCGPGARRARP